MFRRHGERPSRQAQGKNIVDRAIPRDGIGYRNANPLDHQPRARPVIIPQPFPHPIGPHGGVGLWRGVVFRDHLHTRPCAMVWGYSGWGDGIVGYRMDRTPVLVGYSASFSPCGIGYVHRDAQSCAWDCDDRGTAGRGRHGCRDVQIARLYKWKTYSAAETGFIGFHHQPIQTCMYVQNQMCGPCRFPMATPFPRSHYSRFGRHEPDTRIYLVESDEMAE